VPIWVSTPEGGIWGRIWVQEEKRMRRVRRRGRKSFFMEGSVW
jgi:hypothetical protein